MSKSSATTIGVKSPTSLPTKSAWAKGPPPNSSVPSSSRSQSPVPSGPTISHSRRPSALSNIPYKDGVAVNAGVKPTRGDAPANQAPAIKFGSVSDKLPSTFSPPADSSTQSRPEQRTAPVHTFGTIDASSVQPANGIKDASGRHTPSTSSTSSAASTTSGTSTAVTTPASTPLKPKVDVRALFRGNSSTVSNQSPVTPSFSESVASPPVRTQTLSPQVQPHQLAPPGGPNSVPHPQPPSGPQGQPGMYQHTPFVPPNMRQQSNVNMSNAPRSPNFQRSMTNGVGPGGRPPPPNVQPGSNGAGMPSPRMGPQPHPPVPQHQMQHPMQPVPGVQSNMPPNMSPMQYWPSYYYYPPPPGQEQYAPMYQQQWHQMQHVPGTPQGPPVIPHNIPVSPRQPSVQLNTQAPATPPANIPPPLPSARLNSGASAFVPGQNSRKVRITDSSGHEVNFQKNGTSPLAGAASPSPPPIMSLDKSHTRRQPIRIESEEMRLKRVAEEEAKTAKSGADAKAQKEKEKAEADKARQELEEKEKKRKEEEADLARKAEEEKERLRKAEEEKERQKREEEERVRKEELELEEKRRKEEEEKQEKERLQKEAEEAEKLRKEAEEKERLDKEAEKERLLAEERREKEEEKRKEEEKEREREKEEAKANEEKRKIEAEASVKSQIASTPAREQPPISSPEAHKKRPIPGPLDLSSANRPGLPLPLPSALATARHIQDLQEVSYPEGVSSPQPELNLNAKDGKFRYDRDFLLQFMKVCTEKPDNLPPLELIGLEPVDQNQLTRGGSGRRAASGAMPPPSGPGRSASTGLGISTGGGSGFTGKSAAAFAMGQFSTPGKLSSEERFMRSTSMGTGPGGMASFPGRPSPMVRSSSQGGPNGIQSSSLGNKRTRSKRGEARNDGNRVNSSAFAGPSSSMQPPMEPIAPLEATANRWVPVSTKRNQAVDHDSPEVVDRKVRALLNKLTMDRFDSISKQIIDWANKSEHEKDGRTLIQVIRLIFEKATDEANFSEIYARLCQKMLTEISPNVRDEGIADENCTGGRLFRKYLLNRCQEDFERGWGAKESTAAVAAAKAGEDEVVKEKKATDGDNAGVDFSDEYYAAQKAKRQGLGLIRFIGELFKLHMLRERIMHECIKKLLNNIDNPEEEEIESLCKLLSTVGKTLDEQNSAVMDVFFSRISTLSKSDKVTSRIKFALLDVIELRQRKWVPRIAQNAAPMTIAQVHEAAAREKAQKERDDMHRSMNMSRGGSRRGMDRSDSTVVGPDGWAVAGGSGPTRPAARAGDLSNFGKINKAAPGQMSFGPSSVFSKKDAKRESATLSRTNSSSNMFHMLSQGGEEAPEAALPSSVRRSRTSSRTTSVDLTPAAASEAVTSRPRLNLLPRSKPVRVDSADTAPTSSVPSEANSEDEADGDRSGAPPSMAVEQAEKKIDEDVKEFFGVRMLDEAEVYFTALPSVHHHLLVNRLVSYAIESKEADAKLVGDLFEQCVQKSLCSPTSFEDGFNPIAEVLDDIAIDAPKAFTYFAIMLKSLGVDEERRGRIASKSGDSEKLLKLLA